MGDTLIFNEKYRRPSISLNEVIKKGAGGVYVEKGDFTPTIFRALVIAVDSEGARLENRSGTLIGGTPLTQKVIDANGSTLAQYDISPTVGPDNPRNSVRARVITDNVDLFIGDDDLRTYWPLLPNVQLPSPGEVIYVTYEDADRLHGLWIAKAPMPIDREHPDADNRNQILIGDVLKQTQGKTTLFPDTQANAGTPLGSDNKQIAPKSDTHRLSRLFGY